MILDLADDQHGPPDFVVDDGVDVDGDAVVGQDLLRRDVEELGPDVEDGDGVDARHQEDQTWVVS